MKTYDVERPVSRALTRRSRGKRLAAVVSAAAVAASLALVGPVNADDTPATATKKSDVRKSSKLSTAKIRKLATDATVWALAPEFVYRFSKYNELVNAPVNELKYGANAAAWNNSGTNAGDSSVLYLNAFTDFNGTDALVLTVPPTTQTYYVVNYLDSFINTIGSIGSRTTPNTESQSYLLVGPSSPYAHKKTVTLNGVTFPVMASDTDLNWMLIRVRADSLADASSPASVASIYEDVIKQFFMNSLSDFQANGNAPVPPDSYVYTPTQEQIEQAQAYSNTPTEATEYFTQAGLSLSMSPLPRPGATLDGTPLAQLPAWMVPQYGATDVYVPPSVGQTAYLKRFAKIGLTEQGFSVPKGWGAKQLAALQKGFERGMQRANKAASGGVPSAANNYWAYDNSIIGTYPNSRLGYLVRSSIVLLGGSANVPPDAVYPVINTVDGTTQLDGNNTYTLTFTPPDSTSDIPAVGTLPPMVSDESGDTAGFWSVTLYQPDVTQGAAPFLPQAAVLNTDYSHVDTAVLAVDAEADMLTVATPAWGPLAASSPIIFGDGAEAIGLVPSTVYYVAGTPVVSADGATAQIAVSASWAQDLSDGGVPIQYSGKAGPVVDLTDPGAAALPSFGMVQPVSQLGSQQIATGDLEFNEDGSLTLWVGPELPAGAPAANWLPSPSTALYDQWYPGQETSTSIRLMLRMYYPTPGDTPPSILPPTDGSDLAATWVPPAVVRVVQ